MSFEVTNYLLIDIDNEFSRTFAEYYFKHTAPNTPSTLIVAGSNTRKLVKMMFDELIKDYCYCDLENEISVSELATYLHEHQDIQGVLFNNTDYLLADDNGYTFNRITDEGFKNHLSCDTDIAETPKDLIALAKALKQK